MKLRKVTTTAAAVAGMTLSVGAAQAFANTLYVHQATDTSCAASSPYTSIQSAVNAAHSGDTIQVCPGTYTEQVTVPAGENNLKLNSIKPLAAVIQAPPTITTSTSGAIVDIDGAQNTRLTGFTITGPFAPSGCAGNEYGVYVEGGGSADIEQNHITQIGAGPTVGSSPLSGCQYGVAIEVGSADPSTETTGSATIESNVIDQYQKNGITVDGSGSSGSIVGNVVKGFGPSPIIAQNGIQISDNANANVVANSVSANVYSGGNTGATGMLLYGEQPGQVTISSNWVSSNDYGIYAYEAARGTSISGNFVSGSNYDGIAVDSSTNSHVSGNDSSNNSGPNGEGFALYSSDGSGSETGVVLDGNTAVSNTTNGFYADSGTSGNTISNGQASSNGQYDCEDDSTGSGTAGTANYWFSDSGVTSSPTGLCQSRQHGHGGGPFPARTTIGGSRRRGTHAGGRRHLIAHAGPGGSPGPAVHGCRTGPG